MIIDNLSLAAIAVSAGVIAIVVAAASARSGNSKR